jgi:DNA polymerase III delta subunit
MARHVVVARDPLVAEEAAKAKLPTGVETLRWYGSELNVDLIFQQLGSSDLFATRQSYLYLNVLDLKLRKADGERLAEILAHLPAEIDLVCTQVFSDVAYRDEERMLKGADLARWTQGAKVEDLRRVSDANQAPQWLHRRAQERYGLQLTPAQAQKLLALSGGKLALAEGELLKLSLIGAGGPVTDALLDEVLAASPAVLYWELVDAIMGDRPDALQRLKTWHSLEAETFRLLAELRRRLLGLRALTLGQPVQPPFFAQQLQRIARRWPPPRVATAIEQLAELEWKLKSGLIPGESSKDAELSALEVFTRGLTVRV